MSRSVIDMLSLFGLAVLLAAGQLLFKISADRAPGIASVFDLRFVLADPAFWAALTLYGIATAFWVFMLQRVPLSHAYPFAALAFVLVPLGAALFLHEFLKPLSRVPSFDPMSTTSESAPKV